ncbi:hypothetical protein BKI51_03380 [Alphaproteobacteria bacterium AO1-B]|nr:hypothetical protein BKI51_03380 [Alphaproteobacteria bacterium AO1-B]
MNNRKEFGRRGIDETRTKRNPVYIGAQHYPAPAKSEQSSSFQDDDDVSIGTILLNSIAFIFSFEGRLGRAMYWYLHTIHILILIFFVALMFSNEHLKDYTFLEFFSEYFWLMPFVFLNSLFSWSVTVRRMHDRGVSGYWVFSWFIPIAGSIILLVQTFKNMFFAGTQGRNKYGI